MSKYQESFSISVDGDITGEKFVGKFVCKTMLSHRDNLLIDQKYRENLGSTPGEPGKLARDLATIFSQLSVRIVEAPSWWVGTNQGLDLVDNNVLLDVYTQCMKLANDALEAISKKADLAVADLKKSVE